jgi:hypothetical protein
VGWIEQREVVQEQPALTGQGRPAAITAQRTIAR